MERLSRKRHPFAVASAPKSMVKGPLWKRVQRDVRLRASAPMRLPG